MRNEDPEAQATAHQLVHCVLESDSDGLTETLETVADQPSDELRPYVREVVAELINVATAAVRNSTDRFQNAAFAVDLRDDANDQVGIDELDPPVRATIRAMLAELNGSSDDASFQLDLAVHGVDRRTGLDTVRRALTMTIGLLHWSEQADGVEAFMDTEPADEADVVEQQLGLLPTEEDPDDVRFDDIVEANPADVQEQRTVLPEDDEDR